MMASISIQAEDSVRVGHLHAKDGVANAYADPIGDQYTSDSYFEILVGCTLEDNRNPPPGHTWMVYGDYKMRVWRVAGNVDCGEDTLQLEEELTGDVMVDPDMSVIVHKPTSGNWPQGVQYRVNMRLLVTTYSMTTQTNISESRAENDALVNIFFETSPP